MASLSEYKSHLPKEAQACIPAPRLQFVDESLVDPEPPSQFPLR